MKTLFSPLTNESLNKVTLVIIQSLPIIYEGIYLRINYVKHITVTKKYVFLKLNFYEGPFQFETDIALSCEINEVKPEADIIWTIDGEVVDESDSSADEVEGGMFNLMSSLAFTLQREHLGKQVACR